MNAHRTAFVFALSALLSNGCSDDPTGPSVRPGPGEPDTPEIVLPALIVSEPIAEEAAGDQAIAYVSLPPATLPGAASVRIRNVTAGHSPASTSPVIAGGFDPIAVLASAGDRLDLIFVDAAGAVSLASATVPARRAPVVVRTLPPGDFANVPLTFRPRVVFSEPLDPSTLTGSLRLTRGGTFVSDRAGLLPGEPWIAELQPDIELAPLTGYELSVTRGVRDMAGDSLEAPVTAAFTTVPSRTGLGGIAFASTRDGSPHLYVIDPDGTGLRPLAPGEAPAWSPDGRRIAFHTWRRDPSEPSGPRLYGDEIHIIDVDGTKERVLVSGGASYPAWSPDGRSISFTRDYQLFVVNADGSGEVRRVHSSCGSAVWSPDGQRFAIEQCDGIHGWIVIASVDGSDSHVFRGGGSQLPLAHSPAWSPDGSRLAFVSSDAVHSGLLDSGDVRTHADGYGPDWSPEGGHLVYHRGPEDGCRLLNCPHKIFVTDLVGARRQLVPDVASPANPSYSDYDPAWSRTGGKGRF